MDVGIYTRWRRREDTLTSIHLADFLRPRFSVSFLAATTTPAPVHADYDALVRRDRAVKFTDWCRTARLVVWTLCPHVEQVEWAKKAGKYTVLVASCQEDEAKLRGAYPAFHKVVAPTQAAYDLCRPDTGSATSSAARGARRDASPPGPRRRERRGSSSPWTARSSTTSTFAPRRWR